MEIRYIANKIADITRTRSEKIHTGKPAFTFGDLEKYISGKYGTGIINIIKSDDIIVLKNGASIKKEKKETIGENDIIAFAPVIMGG